MPPFDHIQIGFKTFGLMGAGGIIWLWGFLEDSKHKNWIEGAGIVLFLIGLVIYMGAN